MNSHGLCGSVTQHRSMQEILSGVEEQRIGHGLFLVRAVGIGLGREGTVSSVRAHGAMGQVCDPL